ncbi:hypothetical protein PFICI_07929 [Pestalotiopsis fici W106-1]|uniref:Uncharacterized protein n=1 Tax=Pestalotiopsis fici (strain W106-1 / CGMCC3.15140) TaxID=1229662 RepID=W3X2V2_PESFW|nr:uncharacterized protein PFICI_07929 [Pestalotiopsis fici W106-1]ETS80400.1 hypothetical protein PFICI_07929 [Pestalotiopsis fici W106-1]
MASYGDEIILEDEVEHQKDLESYIESNARLRGYNQAAALKIELLQKSSGIFLWVALVVHILNKEFANGRTANLRQRLREIPPDLNKLFEMLIARDSENLEEFDCCVRIILLAKRPLSPQELYFALQQKRSAMKSLTWDRLETSYDDMRRFILGCSKGLAEIVKSQSETVQFIHESVRDFIVDRSTTSGPQIRSIGVVQSHGHEMMRDLCMRQLSSLHDSVRDLQKPLGAISFQQARDDMPFLNYAIDNIFHHANCAQGEGHDQLEFIATFPYSFWIELSNLCREPWHNRSSRAHPLYLFAEHNLQHLIAVHPELQLQFKLEGERYGFPILAAAAKQNEEAFKVLLQAFSNVPIRDENVRQIMNSFEHGTNFLYQHGEALLIYLLDFDWKPALEGYFQAIQIHQTPAFTGELGFEILTSPNAQKYMDLLVAGGVDLNSRNHRGETVIFHAARKWNLEAISFLISQLHVNPDSKDQQGRTLLSHAAGAADDGAFNFLLGLRNVEPDSVDCKGISPLQYAVKAGQMNHEHDARLAIIRALLMTRNVNILRCSPSSDSAMSISRDILRHRKRYLHRIYIGKPLEQHVIDLLQKFIDEVEGQRGG